MSKKYSIIIGFGALALAGLFVLIAFAHFTLGNAVEETRLGYEQAIDELREPAEVDRFNAADPFVTRAPSEAVLPSNLPAVAGSDPSKGPLSASLTIVEYGDFQCSFCAELAPVLDELLRRYDNIRVVWKDLPNRLYLNARPAANAARCAQAQGKFWEYHDALFLNQVNLGPALYEQVAQSLGLDVAAFSVCLEAGQFNALVTANLGDIDIYNIGGTPFLFVGETRVDQFVTLDVLETIVDRELAKLDEK